MDQLHIFFLPLLSAGNFIPMVDMAKLFASRGVRATIVTTAGNLTRVKPAVDRCPHPIRILTISFPSSSVPDNMSDVPTPDTCNEVLEALGSLEAPFEQLLAEHRPDCVVSDMWYTWSADLAAARGIPRLIFRASGAFSGALSAAISSSKPHEGVADDDEPFVVPGVPHRIELSRSRLMYSDELYAPLRGLFARMAEAGRRSYGTVLNTSRELEPGYVAGERVWALGPVSLCNDDALERAARGGDGRGDCMDWLDGRELGSVVYVCFGSMGGFGRDQLREMAAGLAASGHPFLWVVRNAGDASEWMPEGFEEEVGGRGMVVRGWAPQVAILGHGAVGGFVTHCGWNSCLEGASCGVPMATWPLFSDQFLNERLLVDVLRIGVAVGSKKFGWRAEERTLVGAEDVSRAVKEVMGSGEEARGRRERAREAAEVAR
ncbi:scopoletin glucosyltransferase-like [Iris pallida]|uniref:Glycosyltransferase n=1 Tax=Iris pallida TaxID=29817 RepID=A0AAX6G6E3_IRIPA|nr:scopoletin glucosyltransferase-like [Iris pallida]